MNALSSTRPGAGQLARALTHGLAAVLCSLPMLLQAAIFEVDRFDDTFPGNPCDSGVANDCSLRDAISAANQLPGPDIINLAAGTYMLTRTGDDDANIVGDLDILDSVLIRGAGMGLTIIDGGGVGGLDDRLIHTLGGTSVEIEDLTLTGGVIVSNFFGGAMQVDVPTVLRRTRVTGNQAQIYGGGIYATSDLTLIESELTDNHAENRGGAIYCVEGGSLTGDSVLMSMNSANLGGAVNCVDAPVEFVDSLFEMNTALDQGGAFHLTSPIGIGTLNLETTLVSNNQATFIGGGIYTKMEADLNDVWIAGNIAGDEAGGLYAEPTVATIVRDSTISGNQAQQGAAVKLVTATTGFFRNVTITQNNGSLFPFLALGSSVVFEHVTLVNNSDMTVAGSLVLDMSTLSARNSVFEGGCSRLNASAINSEGGNLEESTDTCILDEPSDQPAVPNLMLEPLENTGGFAPTLRPDVDSPMVDAGLNNNCLAIPEDQRGFPRSVAINGGMAICDAGAVEFQVEESGRIFRDSFELL